MHSKFTFLLGLGLGLAIAFAGVMPGTASATCVAAGACAGDCNAEMLASAKSLEAFTQRAWRSVGRCARRGTPRCPQRCAIREGLAARYEIGSNCVELVSCGLYASVARSLGQGWNAESSCVITRADTCQRVRLRAASQLVRRKLARRKRGTTSRFARDQKRCVAASAPGCETASVCSEATTWVDQILPCADGIDNDADDLVDFPEDLGCRSAEDSSELPSVGFTDVTTTALPGLPSADGPNWGVSLAAGDMDGDGWIDLHFSNRGGFFYRNLGDGTFQKVETETGIRLVRSRGAAWGDVDNDGDLDLYVVGGGEERHFLHLNNGSGVFVEDGVARGVAAAGDGIRNGQSASFADFDNDGYLDLFVAERHEDTVNPDATGPFGRLFHNRGAPQPGFFDDVTVAAGVVLDDVPGPLAGTFTFLTRFNDFDRDGFADIAVIAEFAESRLFWNDGDTTFSDGTESAGVGTDENGMGAATQDYDGDGLVDLFVSSIHEAGNPFVTGNRLYRNLGNRTFSDEAISLGVEAGGWGWGTEFLDYDNDGDLDLTMVGGLEIEGDDFFNSLFQNDPIKFWRNDGEAGFMDIVDEVGLDRPGLTFGLLTFDYDNDGDLDLLLSYLDENKPVLFRNDGGNNNDWLRIKLQGTDSQPQGIGARVTVTTVASGASGASQVWEMSASSSSPSSQYAGTVANFGLGCPSDEPVHEVSVFWPATGRTTVLGDVARNQTIVVIEPSAAP
ncbi:MAG: hypothetical protein ACI8TX_000350 [Hyphomicrobiaceae bacterium]|jgi:hypothetical protein